MKYKMEYRYIPREEFIQLWEKMCSSMRITDLPWQGIEHHLKNSTVLGYSGKGTPYKNELERVKDEYYNRSKKIPKFIDIHEKEGLVRVFSY